MKFKIEFVGWLGKAALEIDAGSVKEAVEIAAKDGADLRCANLENADLRCAYLENADLRFANLEGANLEDANLNAANLRFANLEGANLENANLNGANLEDANLRCANLEGAYLEGANLNAADLRCAKYRNNRLWAYRPVLQLGPCGHAGRTTVVFFFADGSDPLIRCGCFTGTLAEFREKIRETHKGTFHELEYNALASHIEAVFQIQKGEAQSTHSPAEPATPQEPEK